MRVVWSQHLHYQFSHYFYQLWSWYHVTSNASPKQDSKWHFKFLDAEAQYTAWIWPSWSQMSIFTLTSGRTCRHTNASRSKAHWMQDLALAWVYGFHHSWSPNRTELPPEATRHCTHFSHLPINQHYLFDSESMVWAHSLAFQRLR